MKASHWSLLSHWLLSHTASTTPRPFISSPSTTAYSNLTAAPYTILSVSKYQAHQYTKFKMTNKRLFLTSTQRHQALVSRDPLSHSSFIYGVITTKIYCRPTCPSRLARRANIVFYESPEEAERDGFRACRRCRPDVDEERIKKGGEGGGRDERRRNLGGNDDNKLRDDELGEMGRGKRMVSKAIKLIESEIKNGGQKWTVKKMAKEVGLTESHFCRVFKRETGGTMGEYRMKVIGGKLVETTQSNETGKDGDGLFDLEPVFNWDEFWGEAGGMDFSDANLSFLELDSTIPFDINEDSGMEFLNLERYES